MLEYTWHKDVLLNLSLFAWRLFRNRLPTKDNLSRRHNILLSLHCARVGVEILNQQIICSCNIFGI